MPRDDFRPTASWQNLKLRASVLQRLRAFFDSRGFVEVETPLLSHDTVIDRHLDPLPVTLFADPRDVTRGPTLFLQTSPEFGMKRLLAAGEAQAIYQITRAFRGAEQGSQHNPEFTMLEWYRVGDDYAAGMNLLADLATDIFRAGEVERLTCREAFVRYAGVDPLAEPMTDEREVELDVLLTSQVQPQLGQAAPTIIYDYPASQSALAQVRATPTGSVAERFELYYRGVELANGYHELLDPDALRERNRVNNAARLADGKQALPEESRLLAAMQHGLPACSGCALGVDRLVMLLAGASSLQDVIAFPIDRA
jgi:lysyl-tRNA synthetase class 2